ASKRNFRKKDLCATKKAKNERPDSSIIKEEVNSNIIVNQANKRENIFYDPLKIPDFNKCFHHHCRRLWSKVKHAHREAQKKMQKEYNILETFSPQCFKNSFDKVVVDFFDLVKLTVAEDAIAI
ncbi:19080_t:CDS:2, partial [Gigaspora margarita]